METRIVAGAFGEEMKEGRRAAERVKVKLPVALDKATGLTRDVSASGIYFETQTPLAENSEVDFAIALDSPAGKLRLKCKGYIVRVESRGRKTGVAVKIADSWLEAVD
jgi:PilZ domain.